ncbi:hypothetical protein G9A89_022605 [Geosiphon pyriformis]|nr:hypothetical protein G9A89_022605 [Geosiphon pyriformis]
MIKSILECLFCKIVLDYLVVNNVIVVEPEEIKLKNNKIMKEWTKKQLEIDMAELFLVIDDLPNDKAARLSGIPNELWKHCNGEVLVCLLKLMNLCLSLDTVPAISLACSKFGVFYDNNFLVLKGTFTQSPIFAIGFIVKDALKKNKEWFIWFFGNIYKDKINRVMTDFGLSESYRHLCKYRIDTRFVVKSDRIKTVGRKTSFLAVNAFASTQYILNIASEFFEINNISINNNKTNALLLINDLPISIVKKSESHQYLGIFLSTESLFKPSLAQAHVDVRFFSNVVLRKTITNKQFCYLVLAVLQLIISYCTQLSFVSLDVYCKWNVIIRKSLKTKAGLPCNFPSKVLYYLSLNNLKPFEQMQLYVSPMNNFLVGVVKIFLVNKLFLTNNLPCVFHESGIFLMSGILDQFLYYKFVFLLKQFGIAFGDRLLDKKRKLDPRGFVPYWFRLTSDFMSISASSEVKAAAVFGKDMLNSDCIEVYMDRSLKGVGSIEVTDEAAVYFPAADMSIGFKMTGLLFSTLTELQTVALALECVLSSCSVILYSDSQ